MYVRLDTSAYPNMNSQLMKFPITAIHIPSGHIGFKSSSNDTTNIMIFKINTITKVIQAAILNAEDIFNLPSLSPLFLYLNPAKNKKSIATVKQNADAAAIPIARIRSLLYCSLSVNSIYVSYSSIHRFSASVTPYIDVAPKANAIKSNIIDTITNLENFCGSLGGGGGGGGAA